MSEATDIIVEHVKDGIWTAASVGHPTVFGTGSTRQKALTDLRHNIRDLNLSLGDRGLPSTPQYKFPRLRADAPE